MANLRITDQRITLADFDLTTGVVSNAINLDTGISDDNPYGVEFSPNGNYLYVGNLDEDIIQFDVNAGGEGAIITSANRYPAPMPIASLRTGPDGKIYCAQVDEPFLGVINNPNLPGAAADVQFNAVDLGGRKSLRGLPTFAQSFITDRIVSDIFCLSVPSVFSVSAAVVGNPIWDFGDPASGVNNTDIGMEVNHQFRRSRYL